jgi:hypothetical protein
VRVLAAPKEAGDQVTDKANEPCRFKAGDPVRVPSWAAPLRVGTVIRVEWQSAWDNAHGRWSGRWMVLVDCERVGRGNFKEEHVRYVDDVIEAVSLA